jgi:serine-type D-Ala-D-Ala carboxypeptidase (penicillin-binding protein 5/6)
MTKKSVLSKFKIYGLSLVIFVAAIVFLIEVPKEINLVQSNTTLLGNQIPSNTKTEVAGIEKQHLEIRSKGLIPPQTGALAVLAQDFDSGSILFEKDIHKRLFPASTTKVMTALVAVDYFKMGDILEVKPESLVGGSSMGLAMGERLSFRSLLYGMLLNSGNDAAYTIAANYPGGINNFVSAMNQRTQALGLTDTHFQNPAGFDDPNQYSSAYDLAKISYQAVLNPTLAKVIATKDTEVQVGGGKDFFLHNLNKLLGENGVLGIKTGTTEEAGQNFIGLVERNGHKILTVVLGSTDRFTETKQLIDWVYTNFTWIDTQM